MTTNTYKNTLNLPKTLLKMKANLVENEPKILEFWENIKIYNHVSSNFTRKKTFTIHDGPPYANGKIHLGHALNKILKDIINKYKLLCGYNINYTPGWDCHGLPIEIQVKNILRKIGKNLTKKNANLHCKSYVKEQIYTQLHSFKRLGVIGNWDNPYYTMDTKYKNIIKSTLNKIIKQKQIYKTTKPVPWCTTCISTLAEAEITYNPKEVDSIYVLFEIIEKKKIIKFFNITKKINNIYILVWTTTPWTIPANQAVALNQNTMYVLTSIDNNVFITAENMIKILETKKEEKEILGKCSGNFLNNYTVKHPLYVEKKINIIVDIEVKNDVGTGCIHIAPAHGLYDYTLALTHKLVISNCITEKGIFKNNIKNLAGKNILHISTTTHILHLLNNNNTLFYIQKLTHNYPYCWRHRTPLVFLATNQCFISMSKNNLLHRVITAVDKKIKWYPENSKKRMLIMLENRPDWCISRQRIWGVSFSYHNVQELNNIQANTNETAILDVWFDSGVVPLFFKEINNKKADLYIEGYDQYRGWFQTTLFLTLLCSNNAPCKSILSHGFVVDKNGQKMSKTVGNCITPEDIISTYGADILRLWVASAEYHKDIQISEIILQRTAETYKKIRNTIRYLLGTLHGFIFEKHNILTKNLIEIDKWILLKTKYYQKQIIKNYKNYKIHNVSTLITKFCTTYLSNFYLDVTKNRQYTFNVYSLGKRSAQTTTYYLLRTILTWITPILSFTAEEIYNLDEFEKKEKCTVFLTQWEISKIPKKLYIKKNTNKKWKLLIALKHIIYKEIEHVKSIENIKSSLEVSVTLKVPNTIFKKLTHLTDELKFIFIVSNCTLLSTQKKNLPQNKLAQAVIKKTTDIKCPRCWQHVYLKNIVNNLCSRCIKNITPGNFETRLYV